MADRKSKTVKDELSTTTGNLTVLHHPLQPRPSYAPLEHQLPCHPLGQAPRKSREKTSPLIKSRIRDSPALPSDESVMTEPHLISLSHPRSWHPLMTTDLIAHILCLKASQQPLWRARPLLCVMWETKPCKGNDANKYHFNLKGLGACCVAFLPRTIGNSDVDLLASPAGQKALQVCLMTVSESQFRQALSNEQHEATKEESLRRPWTVFWGYTKSLT